MVGFSLVSLFPTRKWEAVTPGGNHGDRLPNAKNNSRSRYSERLGDKRDHGRIPDTCMSGNPLTFQKLNPDSSHPIYIYIYI